MALIAFEVVKTGLFVSDLPGRSTKHPENFVSKKPKKLLPLLLAACALSGCVQNANAPSPSVLLSSDKSWIVGIWAMQPLNNGIANVTEFRADGQALLYPFNCNDRQSQQPEVSRYSVADNGQSIHIASAQESFDLKVLAFAPKAMQLAMQVADQQLKFDYIKVDKVAPRCVLSPKAAAEQARQSPYQASDFVAAPQLPAHPRMERYLGKWTVGNIVELEIRRDPQGGAYLYHPSTENWHYLYNDVRWMGDALHFQSYSYSDKPELFSQPNHKSPTQVILQPMPDGKLRYLLTVEGRVFEEMLTRAK